jgi:hypothetical protein
MFIFSNLYTLISLPNSGFKVSSTSPFDGALQPVMFFAFTLKA